MATWNYCGKRAMDVERAGGKVAISLHQFGHSRRVRVTEHEAERLAVALATFTKFEWRDAERRLGLRSSGPSMMWLGAGKSGERPEIMMDRYGGRGAAAVILKVLSKSN